MNPEEIEENLSLKDRLQKKVSYYVNKAYASAILFILSFAESFFFPIPPDVLLVPLVLVGAKKWWYYASVTTIASLLGGIVGYVIGFYFFDLFGEQIVAFYGLEEEVSRVQTWYETYAFWIIFTAGFTFIPYKIFTVTAGLFGVNIIAFIVASVIGRGARFFLIAYLLDRYNSYLKDTIYRYFNILSVILIVGIVFVLALI